MTLWILKARKDLPKDDNPWYPWNDKNFGIVVRASTEERARELARDSSSDESRRFENAWTSSKYSTCDELPAEGEEDVILIDHHAA